MSKYEKLQIAGATAVARAALEAENGLLGAALSAALDQLTILERENEYLRSMVRRQAVKGGRHVA